MIVIGLLLILFMTGCGSGVYGATTDLGEGLAVEETVMAEEDYIAPADSTNSSAEFIESTVPADSTAPTLIAMWMGGPVTEGLLPDNSYFKVMWDDNGTMIPEHNFTVEAEPFIVGENTVTVRSGRQFVSITIEGVARQVTDLVVEINSGFVEEGEPLASQAIMVTGLYNNGSNSNIPLEMCSIQTPEAMYAGINEITVQYSGVTKTVLVDVVSPYVDTIEVSQADGELYVYAVGEYGSKERVYNYAVEEDGNGLVVVYSGKRARIFSEAEG